MAVVVVLYELLTDTIEDGVRKLVRLVLEASTLYVMVQKCSTESTGLIHNEPGKICGPHSIASLQFYTSDATSSGPQR